MPAILVAIALLASPAGQRSAHGAEEEPTEQARALDQPASAATSQRDQRPGRTGMPLPRFVSLRASEVNLRTGPGVRYPIDWVYLRPGLPVEIIDEFDTWRRIRDWQGTVGWVHQSMLQPRRTFIITGERRMLRRSPGKRAAGVAILEPGVIGALMDCEELWCEVSAGGYKGWLSSEDFYGLYPSELLN